MNNNKVVFHLASGWGMVDGRTTETKLYDQIKDGTKTSEWRAACRYWLTRLTKNVPATQVDKMTRAGFKDSLPEDLTSFLKVFKAWFIGGYPKGSVPRLETDVIGLFYHPNTCQLEIKIANVKEVSV